MPPYNYAQPQRKLISQSDQAVIENANVPRSKFINQWSQKTTFDAGQIVPILLDEILPGDHMTYNVTAYIRLSTPLFPLFDTQRADTHFFFVPMRLLWKNWVKMMGEQDAPNDSIAYTIPQISNIGIDATVGSIYDHLGLPTVNDLLAPVAINALPLRAINFIYNTWYRDENVEAPQYFDPAYDGPDAANLYSIQYRNKSHDYFTSALPWPQKFTAPTVPLGGLAPVIGIGKNNQVSANINTPVWETNLTNPTYAWGTQVGDPDAGNDNRYFIKTTASAAGAYPQIYADLAATSGVAINTLRQAFLVQQLLERDARGGTRYVELIRSHFGVINPDFRLQRPEYIGGGQSPLNITPIAQTAPTTSAPLGALGAAGTAAGTHHASYAATEHGYILGFLSIKSELSYQRGLHKLWTRLTRYDFYWPSLAGLGEQAVLTKELYCDGTATDNTVFGYQERWQEYRTQYSYVTAMMRSTATGTLDAWHLAQKFTAAPLLNKNFLIDLPPMSRVLAAATLANGQQYLADIMYQRTAVRPIPTFGTPVTLGRF